MRIEIAQKLRLFSHRPGFRSMIPFTTWEVEIFPTLLRFSNLATKQTEERSLQIEGPVRDFTALLDLVKGRLEVFGHGKKGYFRFFITPEEFPFLQSHLLPSSKKRLSLGIHKKLDWEGITKRCDMAEVFPLWLRIADLIPEVSLPEKPIGTLRLLEEGRLKETFQAAFQGAFSPRFEDENHLGLIPEEKISANLCPIGLIHEGARQLERLFFREEKGKWHFLPALPKELHAGRLIYRETEVGDLVHMEWSKKQLKKVIIEPAKNRSIEISLQSKLKSFRIRKSIRQKGEKRAANTPIDLIEKQRLYLDHFEH